MGVSKRLLIGATSTIALGVVLYNLYSYYLKRKVEQKPEKKIALSINHERELLWKVNTPCLPSFGPVFLFGKYEYLNNNAFAQAVRENRRVLISGTSLAIEQFLKGTGPEELSCVITTPELSKYFGSARCDTFDKLIFNKYLKSWIPFTNAGILECNIHIINTCPNVTLIVTKEMLSNYETELVWMIVKDWIISQIKDAQNQNEKQVIARIVYEELLNAVGTLEASDGNRPWAAIFSKQFSFLYPMDHLLDCNDAEYNEKLDEKLDEKQLDEKQSEDEYFEVNNENNDLTTLFDEQQHDMKIQDFEHVETIQKPFEGELI